MRSIFDLDAYLRRVECGTRVCPDFATLTALHRAHLGAIPFENLEIQMGGSIQLGIHALQAKMVQRRRGGYCFEQNTLFAAALEAIGFDPLTCEARVRHGMSGGIRPRTHMVLVVPCEDRQWLVDVGFGGDGILEPVALHEGPTNQGGFTYRILADGPLLVLQRAAFGEGGWEDLYAFRPEPVYPVDFEVANWFTSTHPSSPFVNNVTAQRTLADARHVLRNLTYTTSRSGAIETREISREDLVPLLRGTFNLDIPEDARFLALDRNIVTV
jgi:N-hydroxyarylamine O-acetyltransferase